MDHLTDHQAKIIHLIHPKILDQITETTVTRATTTATIGRITAETTAGTEITNNIQDTNRETKIFNALVAADYIDEIECTESICQQQA